MYNDGGRFLVGKDEKIDVEEIEKRRRALCHNFVKAMKEFQEEVKVVGGQLHVSDDSDPYKCLKVEFWPIYKTGGFELERLL